MKIRFQADADLRVPIIKGLKRREPTIDFATAHEAGFAGLDDQAVLMLTASRGRVLVSHDVSTIPENFSGFIQEQTLVFITGPPDAPCKISIVVR